MAVGLGWQRQITRECVFDEVANDMRETHVPVSPGEEETQPHG